MNGTRQHSAGRERGAALIVAIGVLTLLLVIALTFFRASIGDVRTAQNTVDGVRAELLADGATAVAIGFLNHDRFIHPTYTSLDHAWKTYFNGTAFAGKPHLWAPIADPVPANGVHRMSLLRSRVLDGNNDLVDRVGIIEIDRRLITPATLSDALYIPRQDFDIFPTLGGPAQATAPEDYVTVDPDSTDPANPILQNPFVITADLADPNDRRKFSPLAALMNDPRLDGSITFPEDRAALEATVYDAVAPNGRVIRLFNDGDPNDRGDETLPYEQVHFITDVDNDGDGLNDSIWLPVGADRYYPEDGLDNDLDGFIDGADVDGEPGVFMYRGDTDGIDNDFDDVVDEDDEFFYVTFTVPMPWRADLDENGTLDRVIPSAAEFALMGITSDDIVRFEGDVNPTTLEPMEIGQGRIGNFIYSRDNDYDLVLDQPVDASQYMLTPRVIAALANGDDPGCPDPTLNCAVYRDLLVTIIGPQALADWINDGAYGAPVPTWGRDGLDNDGDGMIDEGDEAAYLIQGETVTELTGRMAILITDESSKVNINATGGWTYPVFPDPVGFSLVGPLLGIDPDPSAPTTPLQRAFAEGIGPHEFDTRVVPGVGVDRSRWMWQYLMGARQGYFAQGITTPNPFTLPYHTFDREGDATLPGLGYVDDNANLLQLALSRKNNRGGPNFLLDVSGPVIDPTIDLGLDGRKWDGIDEPGEYQPFRPLRNPVAEISGDDEDGDEIFDEIGELGDQYFRTYQQLKLINAGTFNNAGFEGVRGFNDEGVFNELRNFFTAHSSDRNERHFHQDLVLASFRDAQRRQTTGQRKDLNLTRSGDVARAAKRDWTFLPSAAEVWSTAGGALDQRVATLIDTDFDPVQTGTVDFLRGLRQENMTMLSEERIMDYQPAAGNVFAMMADAELRVHQAAATLKDFADLDYTRSVDDQIFVDDLWWRDAAAPSIGDPDVQIDTAARIAQSQRIYYTTAGLEAIRINEIMARPVRRFEAEAETNIDVTDAANQALRGLYPNRFVPTVDLVSGLPFTPEEREEQGFRMRVRTTENAVNDYNTDRNAGQSVSMDNAELDDSWGRVLGSGLLGLEAAWSTYRRYLTVTDPDDGNGTGMEYSVPDVVQFSIQATDSMPAGRYYATVNTQWVDAATGEVRESVSDQDDFQFAIKTGALEHDWFADAMNIESYVNSGQIYNPWRTPALLGSEALGGSQGMAFLQGDAFFRFAPLVPAGNVFTNTNEGFRLNNILDRNLGFTIEIPERAVVVPPDPPIAPEDDQWIHIAFRRGPGTEDGRGFVVNYIEFSQEPDHEWVEIVNQSDDIVDVSGWQLAVEAHPLGLGPMTIPDGTLIAPRGMLLLGTNKFDYGNNIEFDVNDNPLSLIPGDPSAFADPDLFDRGVGFYSNGIGLVDGGPLNVTPFEFVTAPQIFYDGGAGDEGSVFEGNIADGFDFVDRDGDGVYDQLPGRQVEDETVSTVDPSLASFSILGTKAWDRIVELIVPDLVSQIPGSNFSAMDVGRIVLGGGIFPNRPEFDATDNDSDNRVLGSDGRDNNGDGDIDEAGEADGIDNDGDGEIDEAFEGFNEGRYALEQRRTDLVQGLSPTAVPGGFNLDFVPYVSLFFDFDVSLPDFWTGGTDDNPPQWKEFLERRNFPGDNVIVTLYEGPASEARPADRITYTQRDVENRQIDDVIMVTDFDLVTTGVGFADAALSAVGVQEPLHTRFESFWPENTMGQDFARSLERKHPDYTGDRFGTQNRFQATDGNYDDWSESTGRWARRMSIDTGGLLQDTVLLDRRFIPIYSHALSGTPLRRNVPARIAEEFDFTLNAFTPSDRSGTFAVVNFRNRPLVSPADALTMPHTSRRAVVAGPMTNVITNETYLLDRASTNIEFAPDLIGVGDLTYDSVMLGQRFDDSPVREAINFFHDVRALVGDVGTTDSVSLNVGQATVIQVARPGGLNPPTAYSPGDPWDTFNGRPPQSWAPLMMFELADDTAPAPPYGYEAQYLFQPVASLPTTVDNTRWPMPLRTALYASRNFVDFGPGDPLDGAQAVFVWDGDDGLENGEYDLYVVTTEDLNLLLAANQNGGNLLTRPRVPPDPPAHGIGLPFVSATAAIANDEIFLDIEVLRDSNGDRKAWTPDLFPGDFLTDNQLQRGQIIGAPLESFGVVRNAQPDADGVIRYGHVRVENNFLAVSIRNRSGAGNIARISRVVLAARGKTPGRININTVETKRINDVTDPDAQFSNFYNPLTGVPGVLSRYLDNSGVFPSDMTADIGDPLDPIVDVGNGTSEINNEGSAVYLARQIVEQRLRLLREQPDGRYYELASDLLADAHFARVADNPATGAVDDAALRPPLVVEQNNYLPDINDDSGVDTTAIRAGALREAAYRLGKMHNLITVKGEVFEILVTVQSGYGTDANGDGRINWRDSSEFTPMAEKTARTIYER